jgi:hypothetical protein
MTSRRAQNPSACTRVLLKEGLPAHEANQSDEFGCHGVLPKSVVSEKMVYMSAGASRSRCGRYRSS